MSAQDRSGITLPPATIEAVSALMVSLGDPKRIALLELLRRGESHGLKMADELDVPPKNVSHHLAILLRAGLISRRRDGRLVLYAIEDWGALWLIEQAARALSDPGD